MRKSEMKRNSRLYRPIVSLWLGLWLITPGWAFALPTEGVVVPGSGDAVITQTAQDMVIQQNTQQLITNWQSFNIQVSESVTFNQPNSSAVALNRVIGVDPSVILGKLSANGQVFLTNPSGVVFGAGSVVDVHGLLATTYNISDANFLNRNYQFTQDPNLPLASVINNGTINARRYVGLSAPAVENTGSIIVADLGTLRQDYATATTLDFNGDGLISFAVAEQVSGLKTDAKGNLINDQINNSGIIQANGGQVLLSTRLARDVITNVVNHSAIIEAQTVLQENGKIVLSSVREEVAPAEMIGKPFARDGNGLISLVGGAEGNIQLAGTLDAAGVLVATGGGRKGSGTVTVGAGESLTTNNGHIAIIADDLVLDGDLNSGEGNVFFVPADGGNLTLSPDGSKGAGLGGNDLGHITANNLVIGTTGNIHVKGMNEESTQGISGSVFLISAGNIIFNVEASVFSALNAYAFNDINVNQNVTTTKGDFVAVADLERNGKGNFNVPSDVVITSARDIDVSAPLINAEDPSFNETRDLILNGDVAEPPLPEPPAPSVVAESINQGSLGSFLTEFFENGGSSGGC
jgi:filamentous hemagglutinin family protein